MSEERVLYQVSDGIARVTLNRANKHNALDMPMFDAITRTIARIKKDKRVRVVIVNGDGESFCSGLDVKSVMTNQRNALRLLWKWWPGQANLAQRVTVGWRQLDVPVIMVLHGKCWGGGMQIALGGDYRIAEQQTSLAIMESRWGLIPDMGGTLALTENMPLDQAMKMAMLGEPVTTQEALSAGLITAISDNPEQAATDFANQLMQRSPDTNKAIKKLYHKVWCRHGNKILGGETINQWKIIGGKNRQIAVKRALGEKDLEFR